MYGIRTNIFGVLVVSARLKGSRSVSVRQRVHGAFHSHLNYMLSVRCGSCRTAVEPLVRLQRESFCMARPPIAPTPQPLRSKEAGVFSSAGLTSSASADCGTSRRAIPWNQHGRQDVKQDLLQQQATSPYRG